jgi:hypothetical protein
MILLVESQLDLEECLRTFKRLGGTFWLCEALAEKNTRTGLQISLLTLFWISKEATINQYVFTPVHVYCF